MFPLLTSHLALQMFKRSISETALERMSGLFGSFSILQPKEGKKRYNRIILALIFGDDEHFVACVPHSNDHFIHDKDVSMQYSCSFYAIQQKMIGICPLLHFSFTTLLLIFIYQRKKGPEK